MNILNSFNIISYQNVVGNYNWLDIQYLQDLIISYQNVVGNYNYNTFDIISPVHYIISECSRKL